MAWRDTPPTKRLQNLPSLAQNTQDNKFWHAQLITQEMGKPATEAVAEIAKCAWGCEYYAENTARFLADKSRETDEQQNLIVYQPIGIVMASCRGTFRTGTFSDLLYLHWLRLMPAFLSMPAM